MRRFAVRLLVLIALFAAVAAGTAALVYGVVDHAGLDWTP